MHSETRFEFRQLIIYNQVTVKVERIAQTFNKIKKKMDVGVKTSAKTTVERKEYYHKN